MVLICPETPSLKDRKFKAHHQVHPKHPPLIIIEIYSKVDASVPVNYISIPELVQHLLTSNDL